VKNESRELQNKINTLNNVYFRKEMDFDQLKSSIVKELNQVNTNRNEFELVGDKEYLLSLNDKLEKDRDLLLKQNEEALTKNKFLWDDNIELGSEVKQISSKCKSDNDIIFGIDNMLSKIIPITNNNSIGEKAMNFYELYSGQEKSIKENTLTLSDFELGNLVLLYPDQTIKGAYRVKSKNNEHYFLNPDYSGAYEQEIRKGDTILGRILLLDHFVAGENINHFGLARGTKYSLIVIEQL